jgi:nicotinate-nucleotide adenylyltransferase
MKYMSDDTLSLDRVKRLGVLGGTFDPIHIGHLIMAEAAWEEYGLDAVAFVPSYRPPHKDGSGLAHFSHRLEMARRATRENPHFAVSDIEKMTDGPSYTISTIRLLRELVDDDCEIYFFTGADQIMAIDTWKSYRELLEICHFIAVTRDAAGPGLNEKVDDIYRMTGRKLDILRIPNIEVSSTSIRDRVSSGKSIRYMVTDEVEAYIRSNGLYASKI